MSQTARTVVVPAPDGDGDRLDVAPPPGLRPWRAWRRLRSRTRNLVVAALVLALVAATVGVQLARSAPTPISQADVDRAVQQGIDEASKSAAAAPPDAAAAYQAVLPSLVTITARSSASTTSTGAGTVINDQGQVLTAWHVVSDATRITVTFADGTAGTATVASSQPDSDIAVLTVATLPPTIVPAVLGGGAQVGDAVFAVGNPLGLRYSLTAGVVSGLDRTTTVKNGPELEGLIQFDAAVNPGSSGGPLVNPAGHVLGVVTGLANPSGEPYFAGVGFAVPLGQAGGGVGGPPH